MDCATFICEEIVIEILSRLPVKSLIRFMVVCRLWKSIITSPQFRLLPKRPNKLLLHIDRACYTLLQDGEENRLVFETYLPLKHNSGDLVELLGSDNGLVCINVRNPCHRTDRVIIWNPSIRKHVLIPENPMHDYNTRATECFCGFGGTISGSDYKYVSVVGPYPDGRSKKAVDIYSLKTGTWRRKHVDLDTPHDKIPFGRRSCALLRGRLHWFCKRRKQIFSFDLEDEVFEDVFVVPKLSHFFVFDVSVFKESLAVIADEIGRGRSSVWVMEEYGDDNSWIKLFDIALEKHPWVEENMVHLLKNGELLLCLLHDEKPHKQKLVTYNPETMKTRDVGDGSFPSMFPEVRGFANYYKENLVFLADDYHAVPDKPTLHGRQHYAAVSTEGALSSCQHYPAVTRFQTNQPFTVRSVPMSSQPATYFHGYNYPAVTAWGASSYPMVRSVPMFTQLPATNFHGYYPVWTGGPGSHSYPFYQDQYGVFHAWTGFN